MNSKIYTPDHKLIKRDRIKLLTADVLNFMQKKLDSKGSVLAKLKFELKNSKGEIYQTIEQKSNSFVRNYYNNAAYHGVLWGGGLGGTFGSGQMTCKNTAAQSLAPMNIATNSERGDTAAAQNNYGIVIGTGTNAESLDNYIMQTLINHGNSAGQMSHGTTNYVQSWDAGTEIFTCEQARTFTNNTASSITVNEVGFIRDELKFAASTTSFLVIRDVPTPIAVPAADALVVTYTHTFQF